MPFPDFDHSLTHQDRVLGLLLGGSLGDALGAPIRLMSKVTIDRSGAGAALVSRQAKVGAVTELTCSMLATVREANRHGPRTLAEAFETPAMDKVSRNLEALVSAGPIGLFEECAFDVGFETAARAGGDLECKVAAGLFADWVQCASEGRAHGAAIFSRNHNRCELWRIGEVDALAIEILRSGADVFGDHVSQASLGIGYTPRSALLLALWAIARADSPLDALHRGLYISGPSHVVGSLVGQVLGAHLGASWIPPELLSQLNLTEATSLAAEAQIPSG